jgi:Ca-activated chloride channel homolog
MDNASHTRVSDVVNICQRSRTALYVFSNEEKSRFSQGQKILTLLVTQSGGRILFDPKGTQIWENLRVMENDQRSQYRLVYKPSNTKADEIVPSDKARSS